ncbi:histidine kinase [Candidatus Electronema halotolerans]
MLRLPVRAFSLKKRIVFGYLCTGAVACAIVLLSWGTFERFSADLRKIVQFSRHAADSMTFAAQMAEMQRKALIYIYEGHNSAGEQVRAVYQQMIGSISRDRGLAAANAAAALAGTHLNAYYEAFKEVRQQRNIRERLTKMELRIYATRAQQLIEEMTREEERHKRLECARMLNAFLQIEKNAYRYFDSLDGQFIRAASDYIEQTRSMLGIFSNRQRTADLAAVLDQYESTFLEAVQRTRGYLYLVNVVMAAEAYETMYQVRKLAKIMSDASEQAQEEVTAHISSRLWLLLLTSGLLLLFIILFSWIIIKSITTPLNRLTQTFQRLAAGSSEADIPPYPLEDELGALTRAAASFKAKNIELEESKKELEHSNDELEQFVYTVSHDLKSPIVTSMGFIGIIRKLADQGKAEQAVGMLDKVVKANERMSQLINDLLELSRVGRIDMETKPFDLNLLLADFARSRSEVLAQEQFRLLIEPGLPTILANESRALQIFENILSNALKYANQKRNGCLRISSASDAAWHHVLCADNGPGIPEEYREKIFGLFYRLDVNMEGTGIGLAVARKIMKLHGGEIWVEAGPEGGAVFHLTFPKTEPGIRQEG